AWDLRSGKLLWSRREPQPEVHELHRDWFDVSPDGRTVAASFSGKEIALLDVRTGAPIRSLSGPGASVGVVRFVGDDTGVAMAQDHTAYTWDPKTGELRRKLALPGEAGWSLAASPELRTVALGTNGATVLWDLASGELRATLSHGRRSGAALFAGPVLLTG